MDKKDTDLQEQEAPLKNTDNAFVQVSEDGSPSIPKEDKPEAGETKSDTTTDLDKR